MVIRNLRHSVLTLAVLIGISITAHAQGSDPSPPPSETTGTFLPVMTQAEIDALVNPQTGFIVYNSTTGQLMCNFGTAESPSFLNLPAVPPGGAGVGTEIAFWTPSGTTNQLTSDDDLFWDNEDKELGVGTNDPNTTVDVDGGLSVRPPATILVDEDDEEITVGNRSYLRINSDDAPSIREIILSDGLQTGQILVIECIATGGDGIYISENNEGHSVEMSIPVFGVSSDGEFSMRDTDTITFIWNGSDWVEIARAHNSITPP